MNTALHSRFEVDPKVTEEFLMTQDEVVDASVWLDRGRLRAHVTVSDRARWTREALQDACARQVGPGHTPDEFLVLQHRIRRG